MKLPLADIEALINRKIAPPVAGVAPSPVDTARAALAKGDLDGVFKEADKEKQQGRELAMLEGTAALAKFRGSPKPEWNLRALAAFQRAMALADPDSPTEWEAWTDAAVSAASVLYELARYAEAEPLLRELPATPQIQERAELPGSRRGSQRPGDSAPGHEPHGGGRAADAPGTGNRRAVVRPRASRRRQPSEQPGGLLQGTNRMSEAELLFRRAWRSTSGRTAPNIPTSPRTSTTWRICSKPRTGWRRPSR